MPVGMRYPKRKPLGGPPTTPKVWYEAHCIQCCGARPTELQTAVCVENPNTRHACGALFKVNPEKIVSKCKRGHHLNRGGW